MAEEPTYRKESDRNDSGTMMDFIVVTVPTGYCPVLEGSSPMYHLDDSDPKLWKVTFYFERGTSSMEEIWWDSGVATGTQIDLKADCSWNIRDRPGTGTVTLGAGSGGGAGIVRIADSGRFRARERYCVIKVITKVVYPCPARRA